MKRPTRTYHVARVETSEDAMEAAALARAKKAGLSEPVIKEVHNVGIADDGVALVQYVCEEAKR